MHLGAIPDGRANAPEISNTLLPHYHWQQTLALLLIKQIN